MVYEHVESANSTQLTLKALEIHSASKKKFFIRNQKELKLNKNPDCNSFR